MIILSFRKPLPALSDFKSHSHQRYKAFEIRLNRHPDLRKKYIDFMQDYLSSRHLKLVPMRDCHNPLSCYIISYVSAIYLHMGVTSVHCYHITDKLKVALLKRSTIPRLELCGVVLALKVLRCRCLH